MYDIKVSEVNKQEQEIREQIEALTQSFDAINMNQSPFQTRHFVVAQHDTPERQWWQAVLELKTCLMNIYEKQLDIEEKELDLEILDAQSVEDEYVERRRDIERRRVYLSLEQMNASRIANTRKAKVLFTCMREIEEKCNDGEPYTQSQLVEAETDYWDRRLTRQALLSAGNGRLLGVGNTDALIQSKIEPGDENPIFNSSTKFMLNSIMNGVVRPQLPDKAGE